jgi:hypothetical protein
MAERRQRRKTSKRKGKKAVLVYLPNEEADRLTTFARERRVTKTELVRLAVGRLINQLNSGQLELPLGV